MPLPIPKPKVTEYHLSIDPSINSCGIAVWKTRKLIYWDLLKPSIKSNDYREKSRDIFKQIKEICTELKDCQIVCEGQQQFGVAGYMSRESGSIQKLIFITGMISSIPDTVIIEPNQWKGQMSKEVCKNRAKKIFTTIDIENMDHNIIDAILIGQKFLFGRF